MQVCTSLQTDNHTSTPPLIFYRPDAHPVAQPTSSKHRRHLVRDKGPLNVRTHACVCVPVAVVEDKFLNKREDDELEDDPVKRWQFAAEAASTPLHHNERRIHERNADDRLIDDHPDDSLSQLSTIHLRRHQHLLHPLTPHIMPRYTHKQGSSAAEWLVCWTQAQKGPGSNRSRDAVG